ncbi:hypothetical protein DMP17_00685 [Pseudonocardia sp. TMWB2A]
MRSGRCKTRGFRIAALLGEPRGFGLTGCFRLPRNFSLARDRCLTGGFGLPRRFGPCSGLRGVSIGHPLGFGLTGRFGLFFLMLFKQSKLFGARQFHRTAIFINETLARERIIGGGNGGCGAALAGVAARLAGSRLTSTARGRGFGRRA